MENRDKKIILVVPSIRQNSFERFVNEWDKVGLFDHVDLMLVEDNPKQTFESKKTIWHYSWEDIEHSKDVTGFPNWLIPRRSDTVRSYGYYQAWLRRKLDYKYVLTLDDDCYPPTVEQDGFTYEGGAIGFLRSHINNLEGTTHSRWFNTLHDVKPRGIPFKETGKFDDVFLSHGLWTNVLDYDAPTQLVDPKEEKHTFDSRIVPHGQYFPMCGMNLMWKIDYTVFMYHLLMGKMFDPQTKSYEEQSLKKLLFDRFGDIFCGIILKKIADHHKLSITSGLPYVHHDRASNVFANLKKEVYGLEVNEKFWRYIDDIQLSKDEDLISSYISIARAISEWKEFPEHIEYFSTVGKAMEIWARLFK